MELPRPTDDIERAERDLAEHGVGAFTGALDGPTLDCVRRELYAAAGADLAAAGDAPAFVLDVDRTNQRVWNVLARSEVFVGLAEHPAALRLLRSVLGWPMLLGNLSANITGPGGEAGVLHADQIFVPEPWPAQPQGANAAWAIDDFTAANGGTRFVPGSHLRNRSPRPDDRAELTEAVPLEVPAGTLVVFDSRMWHRTGPNTTAGERRAAIFGWYTRPIYRTQENWFLALDPSIRDTASDDLLVLLGYRTSGLGLVNGRSPV